MGINAFAENILETMKDRPKEGDPVTGITKAAPG